jgi:hypothetical protein
MKFSGILLAGVAAISLSATSAQAALIDLTWTGLASGNDGLGLFGAAGAITGAAYTATYRFDTNVNFNANTTNGTEDVTGGSFFNPALASPLISASLTINGMSVSLNGLYDSQYFRANGQGQSNVSTLAQRELTGNPAPYGGELFQRVFQFTNNVYGGPSLTQPGTFNFTAADNPGGNFSYFNRDAMGNLSGPTTGLSITPTSLVIAAAPVVTPPTGGVPEPASWAMMITGFGLAGAALRRRRLAAA